MQNEPFYVITMPVFNDWRAFELLVWKLDKELSNHNLNATIIAIDDSSTIKPDFDVNSWKFNGINKIKILRLKRNLGHQRAIAIALSYIEVNLKCEATIVMDADGEDTPEDVIKMIKHNKENRQEQVIFAQRTKRSEGYIFKFFYFFYKYLYKILIGQEISFGNFSIIPFSLLKRIVVVSEIWSNYSSGILKAKIPYTKIPSQRGKRLDGQSKMNFVSLVMHGLGAISIFADIVFVRLLLITLTLTFFSVLLILIVTIIKFTTSLAIPGWATSAVGLSFIILLQSISISISFVFIILNGRSTLNFLPYKDYHNFILEVEDIFPIL